MNYRRQVDALLAAVEVSPPATLYWFGEPVPLPAPGPDGAQPDATLSDALAEHLYQHFYTTGAPVRWQRSNTPAGPGPAGLQLQRELEQANACRGHQQADWTVSAVAGEQLQLTRRELAVRVRADQCRPAGGWQPTVGCRVVLDSPSARPWRSPGYHLVIGDRVADRDQAATIVRIYWNIGRRGRVRLLRTLTEGLNATRTVFWLKVAKAEQPARCDQAVLYLQRDDLDRVWDIIRKAHRAVRDELRSAVPAMTHRLAAGVGMAEDPGNGESFGSDRCRLLAQAIVATARQAGAQEPAVVAYLMRNGVDIERPYQSPGSLPLGGYSLDPPPAAVPPPTAGQARALAGERALDCAHQIADRLVHSAVRYDDRCTWFGHRLSADCCGGIHDLVPVAPLDVDLYSGLGGVGLFLAELARVSEAPGLASTAVAAFRQACQLMQARVPDLALLGGQLGTAIALQRAADLLDEPALRRALRAWLDRSLPGAARAGGFDLAAGLAGRVLGLARLGRDGGGERCIATAARCADTLIASAQRAPDGLCWAQAEGQPPLLGYAHGTAGAAHALLELYALTGEVHHRQAAERAIAYEQARFDPVARDWPDLRRRGNRADLPQPARPRFSNSWCHGAPGIALSRLHAYRLLGDRAYLEQAQSALAAVETALVRSLESGIEDFSLCHGIAGSMAALIEAGYGMHTCRSAAERGIAEFQAADRWPSGLIHGTTPSLFLGGAGIGHTYLRLYDPSLPSPLGFGDARLTDRVTR